MDQASSDYSQSAENYIAHQKGLALLWLWLDQWSALKAWSHDQGAIRLDTLASSRFLLGRPKKKSRIKAGLFLGAQQIEHDWLKRIRWQRGVWDEAESRLWLISERIDSPDVAWPDIPGIAVGIRIDPKEKLAGWKGRTLDIRSAWFDGKAANPTIARHVTTSMPARSTDLDSAWPASSRRLQKSMADRVTERLYATARADNPGFKGQAADIPKELQDFMQPFVPTATPVISDLERRMFPERMDPDQR